MMRGTFANIRLRNQLVPGVEGGMTVNFLDGEQKIRVGHVRTADDVGVAAAALDVLQSGLSESILLLFWIVAAFSVAILLLSWRVPNLTSEQIETADRARR